MYILQSNLTLHVTDLISCRQQLPPEIFISLHEYAPQLDNFGIKLPGAGQSSFVASDSIPSCGIKKHICGGCLGVSTKCGTLLLLFREARSRCGSTRWTLGLDVLAASEGIMLRGNK
jgi:hypothetical protein